MTDEYTPGQNTPTTPSLKAEEGKIKVFYTMGRVQVFDPRPVCTNQEAMIVRVAEHDALTQRCISEGVEYVEEII